MKTWPIASDAPIRKADFFTEPTDASGYSETSPSLRNFTPEMKGGASRRTKKRQSATGEDTFYVLNVETSYCRPNSCCGLPLLSIEVLVTNVAHTK